MPASSRFVALTEQILLEYEYTDQASPETHETDDTVVDDFPIEIMTNGYTETNFMFNTDNRKLQSGNVRDRSAVPINSERTKWAFLDIDIPLIYNDFDDKLTDTTSVLQTFVPELEVKYDNLKFHLQSSFNFGEFDGFIFEIQVTRRDGKKDNLLSLVFRKPDSFQTLNPNPLLLGDRLYTSFIQIKVPAFFFLNNEVKNNPTNTNLLGNRLTDDAGFVNVSGIDVKISGIHNTEKTNGFTFFDVRGINSVTLGQKDDFDLLVARVRESTQGDFFEFFGEFNGDIFEDFINDLNNQPDSNFIAFHEIVVSEQVGTVFSETARQTMIQTDTFGDVMRFRPIISNSATATSFVIEYILRLINRIDNSQIIKKSQLISFDVKKYGKRLQKLNLGTVPTVAKIFNTLPDDTGGGIIVNNPASPGASATQGPPLANPQVLVKTEFVPVFRDRFNIKTSVSIVDINALKNGS